MSPMTKFGEKMKEKRPRIRKARKEPTRERKPRNPPQITIPWGRGASDYRPGLFTKKYFEKHSESYTANIPASSRNRFQHKAKWQDREDLRRDIILRLAQVARNNGHKPFTELAMIRVASHIVRSFLCNYLRLIWVSSQETHS